MDNSSRRAEVLKKALRWLNEGKYDDWGERGMWFGPGQGGSDLDQDETSKLTQELKDNRSKHLAGRAAGERTLISCSEQSGEVSDALERLVQHLEHTAPGVVPLVREALTEFAFAKPPTNESPDALDRFYATDVLDRLEGIVGRASVLEPMRLDRRPNSDVGARFAEAHRCYLYGFYLACAVLCRAILEAALLEVVGPDEEGRKSIPDMVEKDAGLLLNDDRPKCAREIHKAGNLAAHDAEKFIKRYPTAKVEEILLDTRKILEDLYSVSGGSPLL